VSRHAKRAHAPLRTMVARAVHGCAIACRMLPRSSMHDMPNGSLPLR